MDEITRAVELTKARMLELNGAFLQIICRAKDSPRTLADLRAEIERTGRDWTKDCKEIREQVERDEAAAPVVEDGESPDLAAIYRKQIQAMKGAFNQRLRIVLDGLVDPDGVEAAVSSMDHFFDMSTGPTVRDMLGTIARFDLKIKEMDEKLKELNAEDDGEGWKRS